MEIVNMLSNKSDSNTCVREVVCMGAWDRVCGQSAWYRQQSSVLFAPPGSACKGELDG